MEQLAQIVLNGDGQKLLDVQATEPEIQAFLRNVPNYMVCVNEHVCWYVILLKFLNSGRIKYAESMRPPVVAVC